MDRLDLFQFKIVLHNMPLWERLLKGSREPRVKNGPRGKAGGIWQRGTRSYMCIWPLSPSLFFCTHPFSSSCLSLFFHSPLPLYMAVFTQRFHRDELLPSISSYPLVECLVLGFLPSLTRLKVHEQLSSASSSNKSAIEVRRPVFWCSVASEPQMKSTNFIFTGSFPLWELSLCDAMATKVMTCLHRLRRRTWGVTK